MRKLIYILLILLVLIQNIRCGNDEGSVVAEEIDEIDMETITDGIATVDNKSDISVEELEQEHQYNQEDDEIGSSPGKKELKQKIKERLILVEQQEKERATIMHIILISLIFMLGLALAGLGLAIILKKRS